MTLDIEKYTDALEAFKQDELSHMWKLYTLLAAIFISNFDGTKALHGVRSAGRGFQRFMHTASNQLKSVQEAFLRLRGLIAGEK